MGRNRVIGKIILVLLLGSMGCFAGSAFPRKAPLALRFDPSEVASFQNAVMGFDIKTSPVPSYIKPTSASLANSVAILISSLAARKELNQVSAPNLLHICYNLTYVYRYLGEGKHLNTRKRLVTAVKQIVGELKIRSKTRILNWNDLLSSTRKAASEKANALQKAQTERNEGLAAPAPAPQALDERGAGFKQQAATEVLAGASASPQVSEDIEFVPQARAQAPEKAALGPSPLLSPAFYKTLPSEAVGRPSKEETSTDKTYLPTARGRAQVPEKMARGPSPLLSQAFSKSFSSGVKRNPFKKKNHKFRISKKYLQWRQRYARDRAVAAQASKRFSELLEAVRKDLALKQQRHAIFSGETSKKINGYLNQMAQLTETLREKEVLMEKMNAQIDQLQKEKVVALQSGSQKAGDLGQMQIDAQISLQNVQNQALRTARQSMGKLNALLYALQQKQRETNAMLESEVNRNSTLAENNRALRTEISSIEKTVTTLQKLIQAQNLEISALEQSKKDSGDLLLQKEQELQKANGIMEDLWEELSKAIKDLEEKTEQGKKASSNSERSASEIQNLQASLKELELELENARRENKSLSQQYKSILDEKQNLKIQKENASADVDDAAESYKRQFEDLQDQKKRLSNYEKNVFLQKNFMNKIVGELGAILSPIYVGTETTGMDLSLQQTKELLKDLAVQLTDLTAAVNNLELDPTEESP